MKLTFKQLAGYAAGDAANNLAFSMASMFLLVYYTDVVGFSAAAAGTIFLVVRIWDGAGDIIAGRLVDRTSTRWGKFRPFILFGSVPLLLLSVATFSVPGGLSSGMALAYAYVTYGLLAFAYSMVNIPYGSLAAAMTQDGDQRTRLATARTMGSGATILMLAFVVAPQIQAATDLQAALTQTTLIFAVVGTGMYLFTFFTARETVERDVATVGLRESMDTLRKNKPLMMLCGSALSFLIAMFALQTIGIFYARDVLGNANYYIVITAAQVGGMIVLSPLVPRVVRALGKRRAYIAGGAVGVLGAIGVQFAPASLPFLGLGFFVLIGIGLTFVNIIMWALEADTVEYGEWQTGMRTEGTTYALFSFTRKVGQAVGGAAAAYTIGLAGYVAGAETQTSTAIIGIRAAAGIVPAIFFGLAIAIMWRYPLTEDVFKQIVGEVHDRRNAAASKGEAVATSTT